MSVLLLPCWIFATLITASIQESVCDPPKRVYNRTGDVVIAGLIPVHAGPNLTLNEPGIMWAEAMMFAIREINDNRTLLPNLRLGFDIRDSCNRVDLALSATLDFMLAPNEKERSSYRVRKDNSNGSSCLCNTNRTNSQLVIAVVGGASSSISAAVSPLFSADNIPQISYSSTSPSLSDKTLYQSFLRTIPSDVYQAEAIADMLAYFNWTYVSVVVSDDEYGRNGLVALRNRLKMKGICIAVEGMFTRSSPEETKRDSDNIIRELQQDARTTVVVLWCQKPSAINFLTQATGNLFNITWIGTESWGDNSRVKDTVDFGVIGGMLGVLPFLGRHGEFEQHLETLTPKTQNEDVNPWLKEYWTNDEFKDNQCVQSPGNCSREQLPSAASLPLNKYANVMDAVYAIAYGLQNLTDSYPKNRTLDKQTLEGLLNRIKMVKFKALSGSGTFMFTDKGDPVFGAYLIKNLQGNRKSKEFVTIGYWDGETSKLDLNKNVKIQWITGQSSTPVSRCSEDCQPGFYFVKSSIKCCWKCLKCPDDYYKDTVGNTACHQCPDGKMSTDNRTECVKVDLDFLRWQSALSITLLVFCFFGLVLVIFVIAVFRSYSKTAVVKASNRELSVVHLVSHGLIFLLPLLFIGRPTPATCVARSYLFSVLFAIVTSIMFLKTDRIVRIFNSKSRLTKRSRLLSNKVQFVLTFVMACIPTAGTTAWIIVAPLTVTTEPVKTADHRVVVFCAHASALHLYQLAYILLLALLCTYEAYNARRLPESFNEAKFICFAMFGFLLMWLGYIPGYLQTAGSAKQFITCLFALLTNLTIVILIYVPKLNIILFHPQANHHEAFRQATLNSCLQQVHRLSPKHTPETPRWRSNSGLNTPNLSTSVDLPLDGKLRSLSDVTIVSGDQLVLGPRSGSVELRKIPKSPLALDSQEGKQAQGSQSDY